VVCGDGVKAPVEQCDNGPENSDTKPGACRTTCVPAGCGDNILDPGEACDDGNRAAGDGCAATCRKIELCGDGALDVGAEQCDEGPNNSDTIADRCRTNCTRPRCGDGTEDDGEECDDGNVANGDTCDSNCTRPRCGNQIVGLGEECDDGNTFDTDACLPNCIQNRCSGGTSSTWNPCFKVQTLPVPDSDLRSVEIADLDGNGWADLAVVDRDDDTVKIFWNSGGSFTMAEQWVANFWSLTGDRPVDVAIGDINGDGKLDLATANENKDLVCLLENKGNRAFTRHFIDVARKPTDVTLANLGGGTGLTLVVGLDDDDEVRVIRLSQFDDYGTPQSLPAGDPRSLGAGDLDADGDTDLAWSTGSPVTGLNESGSLTRSSVEGGQSTSTTVKLWDMDGTAPAELVTGVHGIFTSSHLRVFVNTDTTNASVFDTYADTSVTKWPVYLARFGSGVAYADNGGTFGVLRNEQGTLLDERIFTYDGDAEGLASGDLNNDGAADLVIIRSDPDAVLVFFSGTTP
jgi:cysteine-rich repeat protein